MDIQAFGHTDVGRVREHNEDSFHIDPSLGLHIVCDGMGGHAGGEVASRTAVEAVARYVREQQHRLQPDGSEQSVRAAAEVLYRGVVQASKTVFEIASGDRGKHGMGTTLVALLTVGTKGVMANVGDSRLYLVRDGQIAQLSTDHTYVNEAVAAGLMSSEEAEHSPHAHVLTRAVGTQASVRADVLAFDILPGDTFLLCSDGFHEYATDIPRLCELLGAKDISNTPRALVDIARDGGGHDNITALVVRASRAASQTDEMRRHAIVQELDALRDIDLFRDLSTAEMVRIYARFDRLEVEAGEVVIHEGDSTEHLFVIVEGEVDVERGGSHVARLGPGTHFGEIALLSARARSATVTAAAPSSLLCLNRRQFRELAAFEPAIANKFLLKFALALSLRLDDAYLARDFRSGRTTMGLGHLPETHGGGSQDP